MIIFYSYKTENIKFNQKIVTNRILKTANSSLSNYSLISVILFTNNANSTPF